MMHSCGYYLENIDDKYNYTFYQGIYILIFLIIISFLTYLFKYDNVKYAINFFILFVILLLAILCSSTFKNNIIENYADENTASQQRNYNDISNTDITSLTIAIADEPFGRLSNSYGGFFTSTYDADYCADSFKKLYKHGYRGFHIYVEYPLNDPNVPYCVLPYKDNNGMNSISTRGNKIKLQEGMIVSNEPGYYKKGEFGIRIENLVTVIKKKNKYLKSRIRVGGFGRTSYFLIARLKNQFQRYENIK